jgi:sugar/nucleoside kinase (ribokinase family)
VSLLSVGSVALDTVETPFGRADSVVGGSASFFSAAASILAPVQVVGVIGEDYPREDLTFLEERGVDLSGLEVAPGTSFRWGGRYSFDLNNRDTLFTDLGVFAEFRPRIPAAFRGARLVFLGNIDPGLQLEVLDQVEAPALVAADTMNFWIEGARDRLMDLLARIDVLMVNDGEARELADEPNLLKAARWIQERGPRLVVVKKGEHGAILFNGSSLFFIPGYPLENIFDPTGAGDAFAGGFLGYLADVGQWDDRHLRRAMVFGSVMGSYAVEAFSIDRFRTLTRSDVGRRVREFREMTTFEVQLEDGADG